MKRILITGVTSGIGKALMHYFLDHGEEVIGVARDEEKIQSLRKTLSKKYESKRIHLYRADFSKMRDVKAMIAEVSNAFSDGLDALINNAAVFPHKKRITEDGFETQFQVNHLVPALLSFEMFPLLKKRLGRIITTSSDLHKKAKFDPDDLEGLKRYHPLRIYARTKLYNLLFTIALNDRYGEKIGLRAFAVHPGKVKTRIGEKGKRRLYGAVWRFFTRKALPPHRVVFTYGLLVYEKDPKTIIPYFHRGQPLRYSDVALNRDNVNRLFDETAALLNIDPNEKLT